MRRPHRASAHLDRARRALISGEVAGLTAAATHIGAAVEALRGGGAADAAQLQNVQRQTATLGALLEGFRSYHEGLARMSCTTDDAAQNYTRTGAAAAASPNESLVIANG